VALDVAGVHAVEVGGEERRFVSPRAGADFHDRGPVIQRVRRDQQRLEFLVEPQLLGLDAGDFRSGFGRKLRVGNDNELARLRELVVQSFEAPGSFDDGGQPLMVAPQRRQAPGILGGAGIEQLLFDVGRLRDGGGQLGAEVQRRLGRRSGRRLAVLLAEPLHAPGGVNQLLLAGVERVAHRADVERDIGERGTRLEGVAAGALHVGGGVGRMDIGLHGEPRGWATRWGPKSDSLGI
jgi:hypothetical protein